MSRKREGHCVWVNPRDGQPYARVWWYDETGRRKEKRQRAATRQDAKDLGRDLLAEVRETAGKSLERARTVAELIEHYDKNYCKAPEYADGRKVAGLRSHKTVKIQLETLKTHFKDKPLRSLTFEDLRAYRAKRLRQKSSRGGTYSIASVNRELALLRRVLNVARRERWITTNPFASGESLISAADERERARILTRAEEAALLTACEKKDKAGHEHRYEHLRPLIITALDTAMREGELIKLTWGDVDFKSGLIQVRAMNTKTLRARVVPMTARVRAELTKLCGEGGEPGARVFGLLSSAKKAFAAVRESAGLDGLRFHDLRHVAITRMLEAGLPGEKVMKISGHTQHKTFLRYVNVDAETAQAAAVMLDKWAAGGEGKEPAGESGAAVIESEGVN